MHDVDPVFRAFSRSDKMAQLLRSLRYKRPLPVQSMYIFKVSTVPYAGCNRPCLLAAAWGHSNCIVFLLFSNLQA